MVEGREEWFETDEGRRVPHRSKFSHKDFTVSADFLEARWPSWTLDERRSFVAAFSARSELNYDDQHVLEFLIEKGDPAIWRAIVLLVARHPDRKRALEFMLNRVTEGIPPLANYYQALAILLAPECVPTLIKAFSRHAEDVAQHPSLESWDDRFYYLDYLSCSATLFKITGQKKYHANLERMLEHPRETIRKMVRTVARSSGIAI